MVVLYELRYIIWYSLGDVSSAGAVIVRHASGPFGLVVSAPRPGLEKNEIYIYTALQSGEP